MNQENQRIRLSKKMLKDSLVSLLHEKNIHKISVRDICERAEINRTTFYKYYGSQYDLLTDAENDILVQIGNILSSKNEINSFQLHLETITFISDNIELCRILINNNVDPEFPNKLFNLPSIRNHIISLMPNYNGEKLEYVLGFIVNGGYNIVKRWINNENREPPEVIAELMRDLILRLLREDK